MVHPEADPTITVRSVFVIDPNKKVRLMLTYPPSTGRNFDEILRVIDALATDRRAQGLHPRELDRRQAGDHRAQPLQRGREGALPGWLDGAEALSAHGRPAAAAALKEPRLEWPLPTDPASRRRAETLGRGASEGRAATALRRGPGRGARRWRHAGDGGRLQPAEVPRQLRAVRPRHGNRAQATRRGEGHTPSCCACGCRAA